MTFELAEAVSVLERTPAVLRAMLLDLPEAWTAANEGPETWSPYDVVGHLIHSERCDWVPRIRIILGHGETMTFPPFDRFAQFKESAGRPLAELLDEFETRRTQSLRELAAMQLAPADLVRIGTHPALGRVTLGHLLSTWTVHDLGHVAQVCRAMAGRYREDVGPWQQYLPVVAPRR